VDRSSVCDLMVGRQKFGHRRTTFMYGSRVIGAMVGH
jgi:hypothetical protein